MKAFAVFVKNKSTAMLIGKVGFCFVVQLGLVTFESYTKIMPKRENGCYALCSEGKGRNVKISGKCL